MTQAKAPTAASPQRRWFQFSLRTLLLLTTLIAAWLAWWSHRARQQRLALDELRASDIGVFDGNQYDTLIWEFNSTATGQPQHSLGMENYDNFGVDLTHYRIRDEEMDLVQRLPRLAILRMAWHCEFDPGALDKLNGLDTIRILDFRGSQLTDSALCELRNLPNLEFLNLSETQITDQSLSTVARYSQLRSLVLEQTQITDAGLANLRHAGSIVELDISGTKITDRGLIHLKNMRSLRKLNLKCTEVTASGVESLRTFLPGCQIYAYHSDLK